MKFKMLNNHSFNIMSYKHKWNLYYSIYTNVCYLTHYIQRLLHVFNSKIN